MEGQGRTLQVEWLCGGWKRERARACTFLQTRPSARQEWARGQQQTSHTLSFLPHLLVQCLLCVLNLQSYRAWLFSHVSFSLSSLTTHVTTLSSCGWAHRHSLHAIFTFIGFTLIITLYPLFVSFFFCFFSLRFASSTNT